MASLMDQAAKGGEPKQSFSPPDLGAAVPPQMKDAVDRVVAAGMSIMFSPAMKDERMQAVQSADPVPKKLAENVTGLLLTLDQQTKGGIPVEALFPAAMMLMTEAAQVLEKAGQQVTDEDYKDGARMLFVLIGKKLGGTDDQIMQAAQQALPQGADDGDGPDTEDAADQVQDAQQEGMPDADGADAEDAADVASERGPMPEAAPMRRVARAPNPAMQADELPDDDQVENRNVVDKSKSARQTNK